MRSGALLQNVLSRGAAAAGPERGSLHRPAERPEEAHLATRPNQIRALFAARGPGAPDKEHQSESLRRPGAKGSKAALARAPCH